MDGGKETGDRRSGPERRKAARQQRYRQAELWSAFHYMADSFAKASPVSALRSAASMLGQSVHGGYRDAALLLAAAALEQALSLKLKQRLPEAGVEAALGAIRSGANKRDFIDFTLKDLLQRALSREPVGRRGIKARIWNDSIDLLLARNAVVHAGGASLANAFSGDESHADQAVGQWIDAVSETLEALESLKPR